MIKYFDHSDSEKFIVAKKIEGINECVVTGHTDPTTAISELKDVDFIIVHIPDTHFLDLIKESKPDSVRLRVSSQGMRKDKAYLTHKKVTCLFLRPPHNELEEADWRVVLSAISDPITVNLLVEEKIPSDLQRYFGLAIKSNILAFAVLCRGYLFSWATSNRLLINGLQEDAVTSKSFNKVLEILHLENIPNEIDFPSFNILADNLKDFVSASKSVKDKQWWKIFEKTVENTIRDEIKTLGIKNDDLENVLTLAEMIDSSSSKEINDFSLVANAYLEIKKQEAILSW